MIEIEKPKIECVEDPANGTYGKFTVEPVSYTHLDVYKRQGKKTRVCKHCGAEL